MRLEIDGITKSYGKNTVLNSFSLSVGCGVYGLLGPNGAGKSTLIGIITGLIAPDSGNVKYTDNKGRSISEALGFLPQYQSFYGNFTAREMLIYMAELKNFHPSNVNDYVNNLLQAVNLQDCGKKKIRTFSGGMKQRLGIAQALIGDPGIVIFDEPTAGLDPKERIRFRNIISSLGKEKIVILATHIVTDIAYIAKEVILINKGNLLFKAPQNEITESIKGKVWVIKCSGEEITTMMSEYRISNIAAEENGFSVRLISEEKPFENAVNAAPTLDDVCLYYFGEM